MTNWVFIASVTSAFLPAMIGGQTVCKPGTFYATRYALESKRNDFDGITILTSQTEDLELRGPDSQRESFRIGLAKLTPDKGSPKFMLTILYAGFDSLAIENGKSFVLLVDEQRFAPESAVPPHSQAFQNGYAARASYAVEPSLIKAIAEAKSPVRTRVSLEGTTRELALTSDAYCTFGRFYAEVIAGQ